MKESRINKKIKNIGREEVFKKTINTFIATIKFFILFINLFNRLINLKEK